jgi:hypothetical protein
MLLLKKHLVALVRAGKKRQTIRVWSRPIVRAGQVSYTPGLGKMLILRVDELDNFDVLTEADAKADGFANRAALMAELGKIYGSKVPVGKRCYRIHFQWPVGAAQPASGAPAPVTVQTVAQPIGIAAQRNKTGRRMRAMNAAQRRELKAFVMRHPHA